MADLILVGGGAKSGKSSFSLDYATKHGGKKVFIATAKAYDEEMKAKIQRHKDERQADDFETIEESLDLKKAFLMASEIGADVVILDCLTLWISNAMMADWEDQKIENSLKESLKSTKDMSFTLIVVTNEVGCGIVPENSLARRFRNTAGNCHKILSELSKEVYFNVFGVCLQIKPKLVYADIK